MLICLFVGARSVSCMDLTAGVSNVLLSSGLLPLDHPSPSISRRSSVVSEKKQKTIKFEHVYETLKKPEENLPSRPTLINTNASLSEKEMKNDVASRTPMLKSKENHSTSKSTMKKGVSEPNLAKASRSKSPATTFFSPRNLIDRFKRILPLSASKQSLAEKSSNNNENLSSAATIDSDDSASTSSETNDQLRNSRLDHVTRVKSIYDTLGTSSLITDPNQIAPSQELKTLYNYVVHILPEQELGYFSHGNGCLSSSNIRHPQHQPSIPNSVRFIYPTNADMESTLRYFCFPDQHDSNNNSSALTKKTSREFFRFTLTNLHGTRQYGYCSRFQHKGLLNALCLISPYDVMELYEKILSTATELFISYKDDDARKFLQEIYPHRLPTRGDAIHIGTTTVGLYTLKCEHDRRKDLIDSITLLSLSTETIIKIFSAILYEQKLIFIGNDLGPLTRLINTFVCLLYPFSWPHTYVPILPALMLDVIQAPTPYIIGILRSCESYLSRNDDLMFQDNSDILIVDIDNDCVRSFADYLSGDSIRGSFENLTNLPHSQHTTIPSHILPKTFKIELKQEISLLRKNRSNLSLDECQQRLRDVFMSIFVQSSYNYRHYLQETTFDQKSFMQSKQHTIERFLEWFTQTQIFQLFIRQKLDSNISNRFAVTFDVACEKHCQTLQKQTPQRITVKSVKRKSATRANKQESRF